MSPIQCVLQEGVGGLHLRAGKVAIGPRRAKTETPWVSGQWTVQV